jgi:endo-1,4-beta-D-glucanase Y
MFPKNKEAGDISNAVGVRGNCHSENEYGLIVPYASLIVLRTYVKKKKVQVGFLGFINYRCCTRYFLAQKWWKCRKLIRFPYQQCRFVCIFILI